MDNVTLIRIISGLLVVLIPGVIIIWRTIKRQNGDEPRGIQGWLALFIFGRIVATGIFAFETISFFQSTQYAAAILSMIGTALIFRSTYLLCKTKPTAVKWTLVSMGYDLALTSFVFLFFPQDSDAQRTLARVAVNTFIWAWYLLASKRVRNTYGPLRTANLIGEAQSGAVAPLPEPLETK
jgi:hypothetical protein